MFAWRGSTAAKSDRLLREMTPTLWSEGSESLCDHCHQLFGVRRGQSFRTRNSVRVRL
jgi:hypothetical protein